MTTFDELAMDTTWQDWCARTTVRRDTLTGKEIVIEPGVSFFVDALEQLGADVQFSCEGHPKGFYVCFSASHEVALRVAAAGYITVELCKDGRWTASLRGNEQGIEASGGTFDKAERDNILQMAAALWKRQVIDQAPNVANNRIPTAPQD